MQKENQEIKTSSNKKLLIMCLLITIVSASTIYTANKLFVTEETGQKTEYPPSLEASNSIFQGKMEDMDMYFEFNEEQIKYFKKPSSDLQTTLSAEPLINYVYFEEEKTIEQIINSIEPNKGGGVFITLYNAEKDTCIKGPAGFNTYKKSPYDNSNEITDIKSKIKEYCPVIIRSKVETQIWGAKSQKEPLSESTFRDLIYFNYKNVEGWALVPLPKDGNIFEMLKNSSKGSAIMIAELKEKDLNGDDFDYENMNDIEKNKINKDSYIAWIYFGEKNLCSKNEYLSGKTCKACPNKSFQDRDCTSERSEKNELAKWHLDEGKGSLVFDSISFNDGISKNTEWVEGIKGKALKFNGEETYVEIEPNDFKIGKNEMSLEAWVKLYEYLNGTVVEKDGHKISHDSVKGWRATFRIGEKNFTVDWESTGLPKKNQWYHIVGTFDGETLKIYVNGEKRKSLTKEGNLNIEDGKIYIGSSENSLYFKGEIDEVAIYNKALTAEEIKALYEEKTD
jgi:hypothetical protein